MVEWRTRSACSCLGLQKHAVTPPVNLPWTWVSRASIPTAHQSLTRALCTAGDASSMTTQPMFSSPHNLSEGNQLCLCPAAVDQDCSRREVPALLPVPAAPYSPLNPSRVHSVLPATHPTWQPSHAISVKGIRFVCALLRICSWSGCSRRLHHLNHQDYVYKVPSKRIREIPYITSKLI
jgi:hypothetical protein